MRPISHSAANNKPGICQRLLYYYVFGWNRCRNESCNSLAAAMVGMMVIIAQLLRRYCVLPYYINVYLHSKGLWPTVGHSVHTIAT